jgi:deoxyhypusine monooxygenase
MVRHECAEALGSVATETCLPVLQRFAGDAERVVKESCDVALDMHAYESSGVFESLAESIESIVAAAQKALSA